MWVDQFVPALNGTGIKNAEFYADFESVEKVEKKFPQKSY